MQSRAKSFLTDGHSLVDKNFSRTGAFVSLILMELHLVKQIARTDKTKIKDNVDLLGRKVVYNPGQYTKYRNLVFRSIKRPTYFISIFNYPIKYVGLKVHFNLKKYTSVDDFE